MIRAENVVKTHGTGATAVRALAGVDLVVERGEFVTIMGPSGSGKSTLLHLLGGLDVPDAGEIWLGEHRLTGLDDDALTLLRRSEVGLVFQFYNLLPTLTAEENVALPLLLARRPAREVRARVTHMLERVHLLERRRHRPHELSGGEMQRVAIARALVFEPMVVLADEPTGNLDSHTGSEVLGLLREAVNELRQTIVMVTHDPRAAAVGSRIVRLRDGLVESDSASGATTTSGAG